MAQICSVIIGSRYTSQALQQGQKIRHKLPKEIVYPTLGVG